MPAPPGAGSCLVQTLSQEPIYRARPRSAFTLGEATLSPICRGVPSGSGNATPPYSLTPLLPPMRSLSTRRRNLGRRGSHVLRSFPFSTPSFSFRHSVCSCKWDLGTFHGYPSRRRLACRRQGPCISILLSFRIETAFRAMDVPEHWGPMFIQSMLLSWSWAWRRTHTSH